jgi:hypothetical protein
MTPTSQRITSTITITPMIPTPPLLIVGLLFKPPYGCVLMTCTAPVLKRTHS